MAEFKAGDVVRLKADGRRMTVEAVTGKWVSCRWFDEHDKAQVGEFPTHLVQHEQDDVRDSSHLFPPSA